MPNLFVSAHGGRFDDQEKDLEVPQGTEIAFYVHDGEELSNEEGWKIFQDLTEGREPGGNVVERVRGGEKTYDYSCWHAEEFPEACGIFNVGSAVPLDDLEKYTEEDPLPLSVILATYQNPVIYWVACREVSPVGTTLSNPPGAHPAPVSG